MAAETRHKPFNDRILPLTHARGLNRKYHFEEKNESLRQMSDIDLGHAKNSNARNENLKL